MPAITHISDLLSARKTRRSRTLLTELQARGLARRGQRRRHAAGARGEFRAARAFQSPTRRGAGRPGNHDVPWDVLSRSRPLHRPRYLTPASRFFVGDLAVGVNARSWAFRTGLSCKQIEQIRDRFAPTRTRLQVLVTHHPFRAFRAPIRQWWAGASRPFRPRKRPGGLLLAGHLHLGVLRGRARAPPLHQALQLVAQAGTAISLRRAATCTPTGCVRAPHLVIEVRGGRARVPSRRCP
jgi:hypothetical protein